MYEPREDSYLLQKYVKKYAKGILLDMGTGSGILAVEASKQKKVVKVYAVDIDPIAIDHCKKNIDSKKIEFIRSDLFKIFRMDTRFKNLKFDTILFNAPYLPDDKEKDLALDGGKEGYELICRFFNEAIKFIKPTTKVLLIFSSFTGKEKLENFLSKKHYQYKEIEKIHIFFEDIYLYLIQKNEN